MIDEKLISKKNEENEDGNYDFVNENNKEIDKEMEGESDVLSLPVDRFYDENNNEIKPVNLPYETIDV